MAEPLIIQILRLLKDGGPLSPKMICDKLNIKRGTVFPLISILHLLGLADYYVTNKGETLRGVYAITPYGKECPTLKETTKQ